MTLLRLLLIFPACFLGIYCAQLWDSSKRVSYHFFAAINDVRQAHLQLGRDGVSQSKGNDPDDLNSWDKETGEFYRAEIRSENRKQYAINGLFLTPFTYIAMLGIGSGSSGCSDLEPHSSRVMSAPVPLIQR